MRERERDPTPQEQGQPSPGKVTEWDRWAWEGLQWKENAFIPKHRTRASADFVKSKNLDEQVFNYCQDIPLQNTVERGKHI